MPTLQNAPRDIDGLSRLGVFGHRKLIEQLSAAGISVCATEEEKSALQTSDATVRAKYLQAAIMVYDQREAQRKQLDDLMAKILDLFPDLKNFDVDTGECALFKECWEALQRQLPEKLRSEPLVLGTLLLKMKDNPAWAGGILMEVYQLNG